MAGSGPVLRRYDWRCRENPKPENRSVRFVRSLSSSCACKFCARIKALRLWPQTSSADCEQCGGNWRLWVYTSLHHSTLGSLKCRVASCFTRQPGWRTCSSTNQRPTNRVPGQTQLGGVHGEHMWQRLRS